MADIRINALATTAASTASDDFIAIDGSANGTRKLNAYSPTFGGNLTVSGTGTSSVAGTFGIGTASTLGTLNVATPNLTYGTVYLNGATTTADFMRLKSTGADGVFGIESSGGGTILTGSTANSTVLYSVGATALHLGTSGTTRATLTSGGNLLIGTTTDGGQKLQVNGTGFFKPSGAGSLSIETGTTNSDSIRLQGGGTTNTWMEMRGYLGVKLIVDATTALTLDSSQNATFAGNINAGGASNDADVRLHLLAAGDTSAKYCALWRNASSTKVFHVKADGDLYTSGPATFGGKITQAFSGESHFLGIVTGTSSSSFITQRGTNASGTARTWYSGVNPLATDGSFEIKQTGSLGLQIDYSGNLITSVTGTAPTLGTNSTMTFELTSNTSLTIKVRGTDGTTRSVALTLA